LTQFFSTIHCEDKLRARIMKKFFVCLLIAAAVVLVSCGRSSSHSGSADTTAMAQAEDYYTCPMHPQVHSDKPGVCPICGMDLVKASHSRKLTVGADATVSLSEGAQLLANVSTSIVIFEEVEHTVRAFGTLEIAEPNKTIISARFNGRIEKLYVDAVGSNVKAGDPLFDIYSPDLIQAESEYLQGYKTGSTVHDGDISVGKSRLLLLGLTENQIRSLETSGTVPQIITYYSPAGGVIMDKKIVKGAYVSEGTTLYEISDISTLWNIAEVYESEAGDIRVGESADLSLEAYPDRTFPAKVALVYPIVNPQARTVKVRLIVDNASGKLKPNMYTGTTFKRKKGKSLTVPVGAVLRTGKRNLVYVQADHENRFEAREVGLGSRFKDKYEITWGLAEGERVVTEGGYLIDSESQLKSGGGAAHQHGSGEMQKAPDEMVREDKH
jgi:Cu(I)/Ag(I) efflux system membrane fusion protein